MEEKTESGFVRGRGRIVDQVKINVELKCTVMKRTLSKSCSSYLRLPPFVFGVNPRPLVDCVLFGNEWHTMDGESIQQFLHLVRIDRFDTHVEERVLDSPKQSRCGDELHSD